MVRIHWGSFEKGFLDWRALTIFSKARQSLRVSDGLCSSHFTLALDHLQQIDERTFDDLKGEFNCQRGCPSLYCASFLVRKWVSCSFEEVFCFSVYLSTISWENEGAEGCLPIATNIDFHTCCAWQLRQLWGMCLESMTLTSINSSRVAPLFHLTSTSPQSIGHPEGLPSHSRHG